jgi:G3E family GTPase
MSTNTNLNHLTLEQLQILERKEIHQFNSEKLLPFLYKLNPKLAEKIANFKGLNKRGRLRTVWQKAYSAYQTEHLNEFNHHHERQMEISIAIQRKMKKEMGF